MVGYLGLCKESFVDQSELLMVLQGLSYFGPSFRVSALRVQNVGVRV